MPVLSITPALTFLAVFSRLSPDRPIRSFIRNLGYKLRPARPVPFHPIICKARDRLLASGVAGLHQAATIMHEQHNGNVPTIVLGGFIPDATEQVFLMRKFLLKQGSIYYLNYPRNGFSTDLLCAQLDDLVEELTRLHGQRPVIFSVSFGAGVVLEWLKRARLAGRHIELGGFVFISPVACVEDLLVPGEAKPTTLLGRAIKPYLQPGCCFDQKQIEKTRTIFAKMFEAGAQNKQSLRVLMSRGELRQLYTGVMGTIGALNPTGGYERLQALRQMVAPSPSCSTGPLPLSLAPTLVLYSEKETAVIADPSPTRRVLESAGNAYFPNSRSQLISNQNGSPVQHASLIFHCFNFLPAISDFYRQIKNIKFSRVA